MLPELLDVEHPAKITERAIAELNTLRNLFFFILFPPCYIKTYFSFIYCMRLFYHYFYDKSIKFSENNTKITKFYN